MNKMIDSKDSFNQKMKEDSKDSFNQKMKEWCRVREEVSMGGWEASHQEDVEAIILWNYVSHEVS